MIRGAASFQGWWSILNTPSSSSFSSSLLPPLLFPWVQRWRMQGFPPAAGQLVLVGLAGEQLLERERLQGGAGKGQEVQCSKSLARAFQYPLSRTSLNKGCL